jgi:hypothetical protein
MSEKNILIEAVADIECDLAEAETEQLGLVVLCDGCNRDVVKLPGVLLIDMEENTISGREVPEDPNKMKEFLIGEIDAYANKLKIAVGFLKCSKIMNDAVGLFNNKSEKATQKIERWYWNKDRAIAMAKKTDTVWMLTVADNVTLADDDVPQRPYYVADSLPEKVKEFVRTGQIKASVIWEGSEASVRPRI